MLDFKTFLGLQQILTKFVVLKQITNSLREPNHTNPIPPLPKIWSNHCSQQCFLYHWKGNVCGIWAPTGGKSTTLGIVPNVVNKTSGDFDWSMETETTHEALKKVGAIIERPNFYPYMTAGTKLYNWCVRLKGVPEERLKEIGVGGAFGAQGQQVLHFFAWDETTACHCLGIAERSEILILDEPTNGLDPQGIRQIRDLIKLIAQQGTTIYWHPICWMKWKVCSHVVILRKGESLYTERLMAWLPVMHFMILQETISICSWKPRKHERIFIHQNGGRPIDCLLETTFGCSGFKSSTVWKGIVLSHLEKKRKVWKINSFKSPKTTMFLIVANRTHQTKNQ